MIESWFRHHDPFEYEYEYRCTEYEYDCPDELDESEKGLRQRPANPVLQLSTISPKHKGMNQLKLVANSWIVTF